MKLGPDLEFITAVKRFMVEAADESIKEV